MNNLHSFKLIDGDFTPNEAGTVLLDLINSKIKYHNLEVLNCHETGLSDAFHSLKRIEELEAVRQSVKELLHFASNNGMYLKVKGSIEVELVSIPVLSALNLE
ncbi:hypothetical protein [Telluribacter humicola]|uniref:hypothetical protein n=1 Tax=Telluribacter humicola TaxID=1720261 RepID=UPI001A95BD3E|nr:hypothetical protein [Telluribacter humicola]